MNRCIRGILAAIAAVLLTVPAEAQKKTGADAMFEAARQKETLEGDLTGAIKQYRAIVAKHKNDRAVTAMALVRMAEAYQKTGDAESRKIYEQVVREYGDQKEAVALARARLGADVKPSQGIVTRQVWTGAKVDTSGNISPDGRYLSFTDWSTGNLVVRDLTAKTERQLTDKGTFQQSRAYAERSAISRNGRHVAYAWFDGDHYQLRVAPLQPESAVATRTLYDNPDVEWLAPYDWSPDSMSIAVQTVRKDGVASISLMSAADGSVKLLKTIEWRGTSRIAFSPDGKFLSYDLPVSTSSSQRDVFVLAVDGTAETAAIVHPSDDRVVGWSPDGKLLLFSSHRAGAAGLWAMPISHGKTSGAARLIKNDFGLAGSLGVTASGVLYFASKLAGPDIHVVTVDFSKGLLLSGPVNPVPVYTGSNQHPHWSADGKFLAYVSRRDTGGLNNVLCILSKETGDVRDIRTEMAYINRPRWAPDGRSLAVMGTDQKGRQGLFRIDAQTGAMSHLVISEPDASVNIVDWSPDGKRIFFTRSLPDKGWAFVERNVPSGAEREIARRRDLIFGIAALSPDGKWFAAKAQDASSKALVILLVPVAGGEVRELIRNVGGLGIAGWAPDSASVFINKVDNDRADTWRVSVSGGEPVKMNFSLASPGTPFSVHPDGQQVAYWAGNSVMEVWAMENFVPGLTAAK
jgi:Tol biopolymer transport system component